MTAWVDWPSGSRSADARSPVLDSCLRRNIPVATVIGGGYDAMEPLVNRHALVIRASVEQARLHGI